MLEALFIWFQPVQQGQQRTHCLSLKYLMDITITRRVRLPLYFQEFEQGRHQTRVSLLKKPYA